MSAGQILMVDDDPTAIHAMAGVLAQFYETRVATNGADALRLARLSPPDLVLLDAEMPGMNGFHVCEELKADRVFAEVPVIFVTSHDDGDFELAAFKAGAVDFIAKPVTPTIALARITAQLQAKRRSDSVSHLLRLDGVTGLINRRGFNEAMRREWRRAQRSGEPISLLMVDVDHFGPLKEHQGARETDRWLKTIATTLTGLCNRPADVVARIDTSRFALVLPITPRSGAEHIAHRVMDSIEALSIPHNLSPISNHVTLSVGIGCYDQQSINWVEPSPDSQFAHAVRDHRRTDDLVNAAEVSLEAARLAGGAQAWKMDVADVESPRLAREIDPTARARMRRTSLSKPTPV